MRYKIADAHMLVLKLLKGRRTGLGATEVNESTDLGDGVYMVLTRMVDHAWLWRDGDKRYLLTDLGKQALSYGAAEREVV